MHRLRQHFTLCQHVIITNDIDTSPDQENDQIINNNSEDSDSLSSPNAKMSKSNNQESIFLFVILCPVKCHHYIHPL